MPPDEEGTPAPVEETAPVETAPVETEAPAEAEAPAPSGETEQETFDRQYVEKLRRESAGYRTRLKSFEESFDGYDDESRAAMLEIARNLVASPESAAARMLEVSRGLLGDRFDEFLADPSPKPLTREDLEREFQEREARAQQEREVQAVQQEARELGYKDATPEMAELFWRAHNETGGDLKKAHEAIEARKQAAIDEYLAGKKADSERFVQTTTEGTPSTSDGTPKTFDQARNSLMERLKGSPGV